MAGVPADVAVGTNRLHRIFATGASSLRYLSVKLDLRNIVLYSSVGSVGAIIGALIAISLDPTLLKLVISLALLSIAALFLFRGDLGLGEQMAKKDCSRARSSIVIAVVGLYRSIIGSAAGTFLRVYFILGEGLSFIQAAAYTSHIALINNLVSVFVFVFAGLIDYGLAFYMIVFGFAGGYIGAHIAINKGNRFIRAVFLILVLASSAKLIWDAVIAI